MTRVTEFCSVADFTTILLKRPKNN